MCLAAPSRATEVRDGLVVAGCFGQVRADGLLLMSEDVAVGDYLLIEAGGFAFEGVEAERAEVAMGLMRELMERGGDARSWSNGLEAA